MKKNLPIAIAAFVLIGCNVSPSSQSALDSLKTDTISHIDTASHIDTGKKITDTAKISAWNFHEDVNKMDDSKIYYAELASTNQLDLSPPYDGSNSANIEIRKKEGSNNVILLIDKGQFITGVDGTTIRVRFDENKPERYDCSQSADDDPKVLFINSTSRFISRLKKSKKMIIEATLYQDGNQQMEFNTSGFKWQH